MKAPTRQALADLLAAHERRRGIRDMRAHCTCGWAGPDSTTTADTDHRAHLVEVLHEYLDAPDRRLRLQDVCPGCPCGWNGRHVVSAVHTQRGDPFPAWLHEDPDGYRIVDRD